MEASALSHPAVGSALFGRSPLLRLQPDERLVVLTRRGQQPAFETLVQRYQSRLLAFSRHMLGSTEDAEDVLQEVFASAYNAMVADERPINVRPWLYRIARNRCLNHLRRPVPAGQDSMDVFERAGGQTTADTVHKREEFRQVVEDVGDLPETQRTALLLREMEALSYDQIALAMDTTIPSVKSLLVRARVSLAEAAEARMLSCWEVRDELGQVAEGLTKSSPPVRRHLRTCDRCRVFKGELRKTSLALAAIYPIGPLVLVQKFFAAKLGLGAASSGSVASGGAAAGGGATAAGGAAAGSTFGATAAGSTLGATAAGGAGAASGGFVASGGLVSAGVGAIASKTAAGLAAAAIMTAGAVEVGTVARQASTPPASTSASLAELPPAPPAPAASASAVAAPVQQPGDRPPAEPKEDASAASEPPLTSSAPVPSAAAAPTTNPALTSVETAQAPASAKAKDTTTTPASKPHTKTGSTAPASSGTGVAAGDGTGGVGAPANVESGAPAMPVAPAGEPEAPVADSPPTPSSPAPQSAPAPVAGERTPPTR